MKKAIRIISALLLVCTILFTSSCGSSNAQILKNYEKISDAIKENGYKSDDMRETFEGTEEAYVHYFNSDEDSTTDLTFISLLKEDGSTTIIIFLAFDDDKVMFEIDLANNRANIEHYFSLPSGDEIDAKAVIDMKKFSYNDTSPADSKGITFFMNEYYNVFIDKLAENVMIFILNLKAYVTDYVKEDFSYADLGFKNFKETKEIKEKKETLLFLD